MARVFVAGLYLASLLLPGFCAEDYYKILVRIRVPCVWIVVWGWGGVRVGPWGASGHDGRSTPTPKIHRRIPTHIDPSM